ncbi:MAG: serine/threonine protein kinase [Planctomycetaceae bacterium]|nr:serine/threonine protein kinase [Planctomycetaceae bacterium]
MSDERLRQQTPEVSSNNGPEALVGESEVRVHSDQCDAARVSEETSVPAQTQILDHLHIINPLVTSAAGSSDGEAVDVGVSHIPVESSGSQATRETSSTPDSGVSPGEFEAASTGSSFVRGTPKVRRLRRTFSSASQLRGPHSTASSYPVGELPASKCEVKPASVVRSGDKYDPREMVGTILSDGRYEILSQLGSGSMAHVFRARDNRFGTEVVIKIPRPEKMTSDDIRARFEREGLLLIRLTHPNVVRILDVGQFGRFPFVVMQLLLGGALNERMVDQNRQSIAMTPASLKLWIREVARALDFVHAQNVVHRDVKPANILFDEHCNVYLSDFGLTKIMYGDHTDLSSDETGAGFVLGTPNYVAPEIVLGKPYDGRADQYSLGITVYHVLLGRPPMQGNNSAATMVNQTQRKLRPLSEIRRDVSPELAEAIARSIEKDPNKRFESCEEFAEAVVQAIEIAPRSTSGENSADSQFEWLANAASTSTSAMSGASVLTARSRKQQQYGLGGTMKFGGKTIPVKTFLLSGAVCVFVIVTAAMLLLR